MRVCIDITCDETCMVVVIVYIASSVCLHDDELLLYCIVLYELN